MHRRHFLRFCGQLGITAAGAALVPPAFAGRKPPIERAFRIRLPDFMPPYITEDDITYLNETIPALFNDRSDLFPVMEAIPQFIVINTLPEVLLNHGDTALFPAVLGDEVLTLAQAQYLLVTTRFGSVATPHRGDNTEQFGKVIYLKQHPQTGYRTPGHLLLEELIHTQQDMSVMRTIIEQDGLDAKNCLHGQLKGISELGAHYYTDELSGEADYVFVLDDGTHCETAADGVQRLAQRFGTSETHLVEALLWNSEAYLALDAVSVEEFGVHLWQTITTWRHSRDAEGNATGIAPAFISY